MFETLIVQPFTNILLMITMVVKNFGVAIILFTVLIKLLTYPLQRSQIKSTQKMQDLQNDPRFKKMKEKYGDDKERFAQEQMKLYKELGINPFGSCLPTLIQFPIIIGLYQAIMKAMATTPFELLNLERLNIFGIGIPVLTILVVLTSFVQSKVMTPPSSGDGTDQAAAMTKSMNLYMPLMMGYFAYSLAAGLALYFLVTNLITIAQYAMMGRVDWSKMFSFSSSTPAPSVVRGPSASKPSQLDKSSGIRIIETTGGGKNYDADDVSSASDAKNAESEVKPVKPSARSATKMQRPKRKR